MTKWLKWLLIFRIKRIRPLWYLDYNKKKIKEFLTKDFDWKWYGGHHQENKLTYFSNRYYLPKKFGIDFRYVEYSALIRSNQLTRNCALEKMLAKKSIPADLLAEFKKRLNLTNKEFKNLLNLPKKTYKNYKTYRSTFKRLRFLFWFMYKIDLVPKSFYDKYAK